jgi:hypothetical protein
MNKCGLTQAQRLLGCLVPARTHQKTLRRDDFSATETALSFSEMLRDFSEHKHRFRHEGLARMANDPVH